MKILLGQPTEHEIKKLKTEGFVGLISIDEAAVKNAITSGLIAYYVNPNLSTFDQVAFQFALARKPSLYTHKASWGALSSVYLRVFADLTGRSSESLRYYLNEMGVDVHVIPHLDKWWSIKDIIKNQEQLGFNQQNKLKAQLLGELVR
jgi:hypothetical protein